jgi:hypothetical protein
MADKKKRGVQQGPQDHAEGQQGDKTRARQQEILHSRPPEPSREEREAHAREHENPATHRLFSERGQHDTADEESDKNRLSRDIERHHHVRENFQVRGGAESSPAMPRSHIDPTHPDRPNPDDKLPPDEEPQRAPRR